jgi:tetratricopeptide (TPR) repeat protein
MGKLKTACFHMALIVLVGFLAYSNTFDAPFQWDENVFLKDNPIIKDVKNFTDPARLKTLSYCGLVKSRFVGYLTFALNYRLHGFDVTGYHVFNLFVHLMNGILVYFIVLNTFRTPFLEYTSIRGYSRHIALFSALLFVTHPIQTEAVTYIFQRFVSLMAFFYLFSMLMYMRWRLGVEDRGFFHPLSVSLYALSLSSAVLAMKTKENAFTIPFVILIYEALFFGWIRASRGERFLRVLRLVPLFMTVVIIPLTLVDIDRPIGEIVDSLSHSIVDNENISGMEYFFTQYRVLVTYMRLLLVPLGQNINYDYQIHDSFLHPEVLVSFLFFASLIGVAVYLVYRSRFEMPCLRLVAFGIFWFILTLSVESTFVTLPMLINEYRLYLPSVWFFIAGFSVVFILLVRLRVSRTAVLASLFIVPLSFAVATYDRNSVWKCRVMLWEDTVSKSPGAAIGHHNLGLAYKDKGMHDKAIASFITALKLEPDYALAHHNLAAAYRGKGINDKAIEHYELALMIKPDLEKTYNNMGVIHYEKGHVDKAIEYYLRALSLRPDFADAHNNLGLAYRDKGLTEMAREHFIAAMEVSPYYERAYFNLGLLYIDGGYFEKAHLEVEEAIRLNPEYHKARELLEYMNQNKSAYD